MRSMQKVAVVLATVLVSGLLPAWGGDTPPETERLNESECLRRALSTAPELGEVEADILMTAAKLAEAKAYRYPQIEFLALTGPVPQARGDQVYSPDKINQNERWTWFERGDATLIQPLYTFGKISENIRAANHGIEVDRARKEQRRNEIALKVREYYNGILLARELKEVLLDVRETLDKARGTAEKLLARESPNVAPEDLFKLDSFKNEVDKYLEEANKGETLALAALKARMGLADEARIDIADQRLNYDEGKAADLQGFLAASQDKRPEYRQLREGLKAREALVEAGRANYYPDIFIGGYLSLANADKRTKISNPYVPDQFNHEWGGVALGVRWKLDFGITEARVAAEKAQYSRLLSTRTYAEANIPLQIRKYYLEQQEAQKSIAASRESYSNAKKWAVSAVANFDFGIGPAKDIFDALQQYAKMRAAYFQSIYNYRLATAGLDYAVGNDPQDKQ